VFFGLPEMFYIYAIRHLGATRTESVAVSAPFVGSLLSIPLLGVFPTWIAWCAAASIGAGLWLLLRGRVDLERRSD
jgi:drug/metabolite transporter (DMT)-like permease